MDSKNIGKRLQQQREFARISQEKLSEKIGITATYYSAIERGVRTPRLETFISILNALNVSADVILADVLDVGYTVKASRLSEQIEALSPIEQEQVFLVVDAMLEGNKLKSQIV